MENYITCRRCNKIISNHPLIDAAVKGEGNGSQHLDCDCGEMINFWDITAQLREQKTLLYKIKNWRRTFSKAAA